MKLLKTLLLATFSVVFFSCGNTQSATTTSVENTPDTKGTIREIADRDDNLRARDNTQNSSTMDNSNTTTNTANTTSDRNRTNVNNSSTDTSYNNDMNQGNNNMGQNNMATNSPRTLNDTEVEVYWIGLKNKDQKSMYEYTNMSEDQILKYQRGYADYIDKMQSKNMRTTIDQRDMIKQRDGILYDILKPAQYDKYQQWKMKNPNGGM